MKEKVSDFLLQRLSDWGVKRIYGYPGDGINGIMGAMDRADERLQLVRARHEEMTAFMACAHAKFTGEVGVRLATSGPGAIHLLNGREPWRDPQRVRRARAAIGPDTELFVDANGAYSRKQALAMSQSLAEYEISWFEEPVSSDDLEGLRLMRDEGAGEGCATASSVMSV
jgi:L-alanine-DL-glutamate epimerase-like enolase superfamily enzyme